MGWEEALKVSEHTAGPGRLTTCPLVNAKTWKTTVEAAVSPDGGGPPPFLTRELQVLPMHHLLLPSY